MQSSEYVEVSSRSPIPKKRMGVTNLCYIDPVAMYLGGYRYNQPTHLYHMFVMCHAFAYFFFDSVIEIMYGTDDALTNIHHVIVLVVNYTHMNRTYGGFEFCRNLILLNSN